MEIWGSPEVCHTLAILLIWSLLSQPLKSRTSVPGEHSWPKLACIVGHGFLWTLLAVEISCFLAVQTIANEIRKRYFTL
jgi:hypothetical protein